MLPHLLSTLNKSGAATRSNRRRRRHYKPTVEQLEARQLLATVFVNAEAFPGGSGQEWDSAVHDLEAGLQTARELNADADSGNDVDQIWVAAGTYRPSRLLSATGQRSASFQMVDGVSLFGGFSGSESSVDERPRGLGGELLNETVLSGDLLGNDDPNIAFTFHEQGERLNDNALTVVWLDGDSPAVLDGVTITGGWADFTTGAIEGIGTDTEVGLQLLAYVSSGAGVLTTGQADVEIRNSKITRNHAAFGGAGVRSLSANLQLSNTLLADNTTSELTKSTGAAVHAGGDLTMAFSTVRGNVATQGGGIYVSGEGRIESTAFSNNIGEQGGGIYSESSLSIADSSFDTNTAREGGGIYGAGSVSVVRSVFTRNFAGDQSNPGGDGGAIWADTLDATYSQITDNVAEDQGGGVYVVQSLDASTSHFIRNQSNSGGGIWAGDHVNLADSIMQQNYAVSYGGGIQAGSVTVRDSIVSDNVGGGIHAYYTVEVTGSTLVGNQNGAIRGGYLASVSVQDSRTSDNTGTGISGGDVFVEDSQVDGNHGGGIHGEASVIVIGTTVYNNTAEKIGGGITSRRVELIDSQIIGNRSLGNGGGIYGIQDSSNVSNRFVIVDSTIQGNTADGDGGGIHGRYVALDQSIVTSNQAGGKGGGIAAREVVLRDSTIRSNSAVEDGGGVYAWHSLHAESSSITKNDSQASGGGAKTSHAEIRSSEISKNSAELNGGGLSSSKNAAFSIASLSTTGPGVQVAACTTRQSRLRSRFFSVTLRAAVAAEA